MRRNANPAETGMTGTNPFEKQAESAEQIKNLLNSAFNDPSVEITSVTPDEASKLPEIVQQIYTLFSGVPEAKKSSNYQLINRLRPDVFGLLSQMSYPEQIKLLGQIVKPPKNK